MFQSLFRNVFRKLPVSGLKLTYHELSERAHAHEEVTDTYIVLDNVMGGHSSHTELVDLDVDLLADAAQAGALGEGGSKFALRKVSVNDEVRACSEEAYLDICLRWQIKVLVEFLAELLGLTSRVVAKRLGVAPRRRATAHVARRAAAHRTGGSAHIARWGGPRCLGAWVGCGHMRAADLGGAARV